MPKMIISASVDIEPLLDCKAQGLNISAIINRAIWDVSSCDPDTRLNALKAESERIKNSQAKIEKIRTERQYKFLEDFKEVLRYREEMKNNLKYHDPLADENMINNWSKKLNMTTSEVLKFAQDWLNGNVESKE